MDGCRIDHTRRAVLRTLGATGLSAFVAGCLSGGNVPLQTKWTVNAGNIIQAAPTVADGTVYFANGAGTVYAVTAADGTERWRFDTGTRGDGPPVETSPTVADGNVFVAGVDSTVYALDADDGTERWAFEPEWNEHIEASPTVADETLYVASRNAHLYALNLADGTPRWTYRAKKGFVATVVTDGVVCSATWTNRVIAFDLDTGKSKLLWNAPFGMDTPYPALAASDGTIYLKVKPDTVGTVDTTDGSEDWTFQTEGEIVASPTVMDGTVYVGDTDSNMYAIHAETGIEQWRVTTGDAIAASPVVADDSAYVLPGGSGILALARDDGTRQWRFKIANRANVPPAVQNGDFYIGDAVGNVHALTE